MHLIASECIWYFLSVYDKLEVMSPFPPTAKYELNCC